jgi:hypothetical protein
LRGNLASFSWAARRSSGGAVRSTAITFSRVRLAIMLLASFMRLAFFSIALFFAICLTLATVNWKTACQKP